MKETLSLSMDVTVFGVAMVLNETLPHPKDVTACSKSHKASSFFLFLGGGWVGDCCYCCCFVLLFLLLFFHVNFSFRGNVYL